MAYRVYVAIIPIGFNPKDFTHRQMFVAVLLVDGCVQSACFHVCPAMRGQADHFDRKTSLFFIMDNSY